MLTVARRKLSNAARRLRLGEEAAPTLALLADELNDATSETEIPDERLRLMFACAHPAIDAGVRSPLILMQWWRSKDGGIQHRVEAWIEHGPATLMDKPKTAVSAVDRVFSKSYATRRCLIRFPEGIRYVWRMAA